MRYGHEPQSEVHQDDEYDVSDLRELRNRLIVVEEQVARLIDESATTRALAAMADRDIADHRQEIRGHTRVLSALRQTQIEQGQTLDQHTARLDQHTAVLGQHTATLEQHTATLAQHTATLDEHGKILTSLLTGQAAIMRHLGIDDQGAGKQPQD